MQFWATNKLLISYLSIFTMSNVCTFIKIWDMRVTYVFKRLTLIMWEIEMHIFKSYAFFGPINFCDNMHILCPTTYLNRFYLFNLKKKKKWDYSILSYFIKIVVTIGKKPEPHNILWPTILISSQVRSYKMGDHQFSRNSSS